MKIQEIKQALEKALSFQKSGSIIQAIEIYVSIIKEDNTCIDAYYNLANCYKKNTDFKNAFIYYKKAIKIDKNCYMCYFNMADVYNKLYKYELCIFYLQKVIKLSPNFYEALYSMANCYKRMNNERKMLEYLYKTLEKSPEHPGANHLLASYNKESNSKYSTEYAKNLFDKYADYFEDHLLNSLNYQVPFIIKDKLKSLNPPKSSKVLDLGCGTGLIGKTIVDLYPDLVGVDISLNMIKQTRKKEIYKELHNSEINDFLLKNVEEFNLVIAADVFIYVGDLQNIFSCLKESLNKDGYFIFTIELLEYSSEVGFQLSTSRRFSHSMEYIEFMCNAFGFEIVDKEEIVLRQENKNGQKGAIFTLKFM